MVNKLSLPPVGAEHQSAPFQTWYSLIARIINQIIDEGTGGGVNNLDGGTASSVYGGTTGIDGGSA